MIACWERPKKSINDDSNTAGMGAISRLVHKSYCVEFKPVQLAEVAAVNVLLKPISL